EARPAAAAVKRGGGGVWFSLSIGREKKADPKWILPLVCRRGEVTREAVGRIQVLPRETRFEIAVEVAPAFEKAARAPDPRMPGARIARVSGPAA
ncbi:MAG TPA: DbpA RNA binding domain-containing protein, partial [Anaeromyxobacteraceae bacterium]